MGRHNQPEAFRPPWRSKAKVRRGAAEALVQGYTFRDGKWFVLVKGQNGEGAWPVSETRAAR